jgi:6-pyruvoyl-tetrahydropterin synthase
MKTQLILKFEFTASHSLSGYEVPHPHVWTLETIIAGEPISGKIADIMVLRQLFQGILDPLESTYLNENLATNWAVREFPTCETLSGYFFDQFKHILSNRFLVENPTVQLSSVRVGICGMDRVETGAVKLTVD